MIERGSGHLALATVMLAGIAAGANATPAPENEAITVIGHQSSYVVPEVSAIKIDAAPRDIPQTIDVVPRQVIADQDDRSLADALRNVAGIGLATGDGQRDQISIRGFTDQTDFYVDGIRDDGLYYRDLSNVERVEVVKGPSSVLYGRGSSGGLVNLVTRRPGTEGGDIAVSYGSFDTVRGTFDLGHKLGASGVAYRVTGAVERGDSYRDQGFIKREALAPSVAWTPNDRDSLLVQASFLRDRRVADNGIPSFQGRPIDVPRSTYYGATNARDADYAQSQVWTITARARHDFGGGIALTDTFRYYDFTLDRYGTIVQTTNEARRTATLQRQFTRRDEHGWFDQLELSGTARTGPFEHKLLLGLEVGRQVKYQRRINQNNAATVDLFDPHPPAFARRVPGAPYTDTVGTYDTLGPYAQDLVSLGTHWKALLGIRWDRFRQTSDPRIAGQAYLARTDRKFSPRAGLVWQPTETQSYYVAWTRSFQPSGESYALVATNADIAPERTTNKEVGAKYTLFGGRLNATLSAFDVRRTNIKSTDPVSLRVLPIGTQRSRGIEASAQMSLADGFQAIASYAYLDTRIVKSPAFDSGQPILGKRAPIAPVTSASLWLTKSVAKRFGLGGGLNYVGHQFANPGNTVVLPRYVVVDTMAWANLGPFRFQLNVDNLFDRDYIGSAHATSPNLLMPAPPRTATLTVKLAI